MQNVVTRLEGWLEKGVVLPIDLVKDLEDSLEYIKILQDKVERFDKLYLVSLETINKLQKSQNGEPK